jgi:hypothetical protein
VFYKTITLLKWIYCLRDCFILILFFFLYCQTTDGGSKASSGTGLSEESRTKIVVACIAAGTVAGTVVYAGGVVERAIILSKPGSDEERKVLDLTEKIAFESGKGGRDGLLSLISWSWRK